MVRRSAFLIVLLAAAPGCLPDGPHEFYRTALQAKTEYVDSFARVVDEDSAKRHLEFAHKIYTERVEDVRKGMESSKMDNTFRKLQHEDFQVGKLKAEDRAQLTFIVREVADYRKQAEQTQKRLKRELVRVQRLSALYQAHRLKETQEGRSPDPFQCPSVDKLAGEKFEEVNLFGLMPGGISVAMLQKLESKLPDEVLMYASTEPKDLEKKVADPNVIVPPPLPPMPQWAVDILRQKGTPIPEYVPE